MERKANPIVTNPKPKYWRQSQQNGNDDEAHIFVDSHKAKKRVPNPELPTLRPKKILRPKSDIKANPTQSVAYPK